MAEDRFDTYFAEKIWDMIPAHYRHEDGVAENPGVLRALVEIIARRAAVVRRDTDRLWEDQSIETCEEWAVPYIGELVGTRMVSALNPRGARVDVAKTIYYRRRKGTLAVLEELIADITEWDGAVVESFRRLGRAWHGLDPLPEFRLGALSGTPPGGWADLRRPRAAEAAGSAFDEYHHTPDFRRHNGGNGRSGRYNIPKLAFHLFTTPVYGLRGVTPAAVMPDTGFTFDPSGRDAPLFAPRNRPEDWDEWRPAAQSELPAPMDCELLSAGEYATGAVGVYDAPGSLLAMADLSGADLGAWSGAAVGKDALVDPARGRMLFLGGAPAEGITCDYHYGFPCEIGAGGYDRRHVEDRLPTVAALTGGGTLADAAVASAGITGIGDSATYTPLEDKGDVSALTLQAANRQRPYLLLQNDWVLDTAAGADAVIVLDGLWLGAAAPARLILRGDYESVTLVSMTLDPGGARTENPADGTLPAVTLAVEGAVETLRIGKCVLGPIEVTGSVERLEISDSIVQSLDATVPAVSMGLGEAVLKRVTVLGRLDLHRLHASDCILRGSVQVLNNQDGCLRFSAVPFSAGLPKPFEVHWIGAQDRLFESERFGHPAYARPRASAPAAVLRGGENGLEMGACHLALRPVKLDGLKAKVGEYLPFGLIPIFIQET